MEDSSGPPTTLSRRGDRQPAAAARAQGCRQGRCRRAGCRPPTTRPCSSARSPASSPGRRTSASQVVTDGELGALVLVRLLLRGPRRLPACALALQVQGCRGPAPSNGRPAWPKRASAAARRSRCPNSSAPSRHARTGRREGHHAGAQRLPFLPPRPGGRPAGLSRRVRLLRRPGRRLSRRAGGAGPGRLPLRAARRGAGRHAVRPRRAPAGRGARAAIPRPCSTPISASCSASPPTGRPA